MARELKLKEDKSKINNMASAFPVPRYMILTPLMRGYFLKVIISSLLSSNEIYVSRDFK